MNTDIRISVSFKNHRKRKRLSVLLGPGATDYLLDLWISTAMNHPSGILLGMDELDIALEAGWGGDHKQFVAALMDCGFLEQMADGVYRLHDWEEHQPYAIGASARSDAARKAANTKWNKIRNTQNQDSGADGNAKLCDAQCAAHKSAMRNDENGNAPSPSPSPSPSPDPSPSPSPSPSPDPNQKEKTLGILTDSLVTGEETGDRNKPREDTPFPAIPEPAIPEKPPNPEPEHAGLKSLIGLWNDRLGPLGFPTVMRTTDSRRKAFNARVREDKARASPGYWAHVITLMAESDFMRGEARAGKNWLNFDWLLNPNNLAKVEEGRYNRQRKDVYQDAAERDPDEILVEAFGGFSSLQATIEADFQEVREYG